MENALTHCCLLIRFYQGLLGTVLLGENNVVLAASFIRDIENYQFPDGRINNTEILEYYGDFHSVFEFYNKHKTGINMTSVVNPGDSVVIKEH